MKHVNKLNYAFLFLCFALSTGIAFSQTESFYVYFKQNDIKIIIQKAEVELLKKPFEIYVEYTKPLDLLVSSASKGTTYKQAKSGKLLFFIDAFNENSKPESFFLNKGIINLSENTHTIWKKDDTNGEAGYKTTEGRAKNHKYIDKIYSIKNQMISRVEDFDKDVFMIFIYAENDKSGQRQEIQRELVKIKWVDLYKGDTKSYKRETKAQDKQKIRDAERILKQKQKLAEKEEKIMKKLEERKLKTEKNKKKEKEQDSE